MLMLLCATTAAARMRLGVSVGRSASSCSFGLRHRSVRCSSVRCSSVRCSSDTAGLALRRASTHGGDDVLPVRDVALGGLTRPRHRSVRCCSDTPSAQGGDSSAAAQISESPPCGDAAVASGAAASDASAQGGYATASAQGGEDERLVAWF
eukprot:scaffold87292_cov51-Phaeocystis_antarctica.AAC.1